MLKTGRFRALRNIPVGWVLQAIHSTDLSERLFRCTMEGMGFILVWFCFFQDGNYALLKTFVIVHTISWLITGNFWVYMLDSFKWVKNPGVYKLIDFIKKVEKLYNFFDCCDAILIYGSMCRNQLHIRSDLDLRIIRRTDSKFGIIALFLGILTRTYSFFKIIPVDLEIVDNIAFLKHQMREDEKPIVVYKRDDFEIPSEGINFEQVVINPEMVLKK